MVYMEVVMNTKTTKRDDSLKNDLAKRLNKIEGQIKGVKKMIENDAYCNDILNQTLAIKAALDGVNKLILKLHIENCLLKEIKENDTKALTELMDILKKLIK